MDMEKSDGSKRRRTTRSKEKKLEIGRAPPFGMMLGYWKAREVELNPQNPQVVWSQK